MHFKRMNISRKKRRGGQGSKRSNRSRTSNRSRKSNSKKQLGGGGSGGGRGVGASAQTYTTTTTKPVTSLNMVMRLKPRPLTPPSKPGSAQPSRSPSHTSHERVVNHPLANGQMNVSKKSFRSNRLFRSNTSMKPNFKSSMSAPAPARAHSAPTGDQKSAVDLDDYNMFTYDNSPECRAMIGLDHPMLADVTVNDYMHASCRINENLVNNSLKPIEEKHEQMKISQKFFAEVSEGLPKGLGDNSPAKTTPRDNSPAKTTPSKAQRQSSLISSKSGGATPVVDKPIDYVATDPAQVLDLTQILTYDKLKKFIALSNRNNSTKLGWTHRAELFIKYMFLDSDTFKIYENYGVLSGSVDKKVADSNFKISSASYRKHADSTEKAVLTTGPPNRVKLEGLDRIGDKQNMNWQTIMPTLNSDMHTENVTFDDMNISKLLGRYKQMSSIETKHFIFSIILFILIRLTDKELTEAISPEIYPHLDTQELAFMHASFKEINSLFTNLIPNDSPGILPYSAFITTFTNNISHFTGYIQMARPFSKKNMGLRAVVRAADKGYGIFRGAAATAADHVPILRSVLPRVVATFEGLFGSTVRKFGKAKEPFVFPHEISAVRHAESLPEYNEYHNFIDYFYKRIMNGFNDEKEFNFKIDPMGDPLAKRLQITTIPVDGNDIGIFTEIRNQDIISFTPTLERKANHPELDRAAPGEGIITGICKEGDEGVLDPEAAFFYLKDHGKKQLEQAAAFAQINREIRSVAQLNEKIKQLEDIIPECEGEEDFYRKKHMLAERLVVSTIPYILKQDFASLHGPKISNLLVSDNSMFHWVYQIKSRIEGKLDKLMGHLSNLVYQPNDVIADVSLKYLEKNDGSKMSNKFVYVGPFDHDPSYPLAFTEGSTESPKVCYSRVHVWLKTFSTQRDHELYIIVRGSKSEYDWASCDIDIIMGVLQNERSLIMPVILCDIIEYMNSCLTAKKPDHTQQKIAKALRNGDHKAIQMFASGHSLGGYLAMSLAHTALAKHLTAGISFQEITGVSRRKKDNKLYLKPYIIPIVFDPYLGMGSAIHNAFSFLPYVRIHSCMETDTVVKEPTLGTSDQVWAKGDPLGRYDDVASRFFLAYIQNMYSDTRYNSEMGQFITFRYKNVYNYFSDSKIYYPTDKLQDRIMSDMRIGHDLLQMVGTEAQYVFFNTPTNFYVKTGLPTPFDKQSIQSLRYNFPVPENVSVIPEYRYTLVEEREEGLMGEEEAPAGIDELKIKTELDLMYYDLAQWRNPGNFSKEEWAKFSEKEKEARVRAAAATKSTSTSLLKTDFSKITTYNLDGSTPYMNFEPKEKYAWLKECGAALSSEMQVFTSSVDYNMVKLKSKSSKTRKSRP